MPGLPKSWGVHVNDKPFELLSIEIQRTEA